MTVYRFAGEIGKDHRLEIPSEIPAGPVQIVIISQDPHVPQGDRFRQMVQDLANGPYHTRAKAEIDNALREDRESWE